MPRDSFTTESMGGFGSSTIPRDPFIAQSFPPASMTIVCLRSGDRRKIGSLTS